MASEVSICNLALDMIGAERIRSFSERERPSLMVQDQYEHQRDLLLSMYNWNFARKRLKLPALAGQIDSWYHFQKPSDCLRPLNIFPDTPRVPWQLIGNQIIAPIEEPYLLYTALITEPSLFSSGFIELLSHKIALKICMPVKQDAKILAELQRSYPLVEDQILSNDAEIGQEYKNPTSQYEQDSFVETGYIDLESPGNIPDALS